MQVSIWVTVVGVGKRGVGRCSLVLCFGVSSLDFVGRRLEYGFGFEQAFSKDKERVPPLVDIGFGIWNGFASFANEKI